MAIVKQNFNDKCYLLVDETVEETTIYSDWIDVSKSYCTSIEVMASGTTLSATMTVEISSDESISNGRVIGSVEDPNNDMLFCELNSTELAAALKSTGTAGTVSEGTNQHYSFVGLGARWLRVKLVVSGASSDNKLKVSLMKQQLTT